MGALTGGVGEGFHKRIQVDVWPFDWPVVFGDLLTSNSVSLLLPQESKGEGVEAIGFDFGYCDQLFGWLGHWARWPPSSCCLLRVTTQWLSVLRMNRERMCLLLCPLEFNPFCSIDFSGLIGVLCLQRIISLFVL